MRNSSELRDDEEEGRISLEFGDGTGICRA